MCALNDLTKEGSRGGIVRRMGGGLLVLGLIGCGVEEGDGKVNRKNLRVSVLLGQIARI